MAGGAGKSGKAFMSAAAAAGKKAVAAKVIRPAYANKGSVVNAQLKAQQTPPTSCELGKFLGLRDPPRSNISKLITQFIKIHSPQNPGKKKLRQVEDKLMSMLGGKDRIGMPEIAKLLSQEFAPQRRW